MVSDQDNRRGWPRILVPQELHDLLYIMARREGVGERDLHLYLYRLLIERYGSTMLAEIDRILQQESGWMDVKSPTLDQENAMNEPLPPLEEIINNWVGTSEAIRLLAESNNGEEISRTGLVYLLENGLIRGTKIGSQWFIDPESAKAYTIQGRGRRGKDSNYTGKPES